MIPTAPSFHIGCHAEILVVLDLLGNFKYGNLLEELGARRIHHHCNYDFSSQEAAKFASVAELMDASEGCIGSALKWVYKLCTCKFSEDLNHDKFSLAREAVSPLTFNVTAECCQ
ncbi:hypothetical protein C5167_027013 [Papaver somniferum]|nr:hypothetical protein C5167_027013 [Papaver somniferum]